MNLLEAFQDDEYEERRRMPVGKPKPPVEVWEHEGWIARLRPVRCKQCGALSDELVGIFSVERKLPSGARRWQQVREGFPLTAGKRVEYEAEHVVPFCAADLAQLGFTEVASEESAPPSPTNRLVFAGAA